MVYVVPAMTRRLIAVWRIVCGVILVGSRSARFTARRNGFASESLCGCFGSEMRLGNIHPSGSHEDLRLSASASRSARVIGCDLAPAFALSIHILRFDQSTSSNRRRTIFAVTHRCIQAE